MSTFINSRGLSAWGPRPQYSQLSVLFSGVDCDSLCTNKFHAKLQFYFNFLQYLTQRCKLSFHLKSEQSVGASPSPNTAHGSADNDTCGDGTSGRRSRTREEFRRRVSQGLCFQDPLQAAVDQTLTLRRCDVLWNTPHGRRGFQGRGRRGDATQCRSLSDGDAVMCGFHKGSECGHR